MAGHGNTAGDADAAEQQKKERDRHLGSHVAGLDKEVDQGERPDGIGHVIGALRQGDIARRSDLDSPEDFLHAVFELILDNSDKDPFAQKPQHDRQQEGRQNGRAAAQGEGLSQGCFEQKRQYHHEAGHADKDGRKPHAVGEGRPPRQNQADDDLEHDIGDHQAEYRRYHPACDHAAQLPPVDHLDSSGRQAEADHGADDRVGGGNRQGFPGGERDPERRGQQRRQGADQRQMGIGYDIGRDDSLPDGVGHMRA